MELVKLKPASIVYTSASGEKTARVILPIDVPSENVRAIDITDKSVDEREKIVDAYQQYVEYAKNYMKTMFSFETWAEQALNETLDVKWRTFNQSRIE